MEISLLGPEDAKIVKHISKFLDEFHKGYSPIQVYKFILNDVEFPTPYAKFQQAKLELINRYGRIVDEYFDIKELEIKCRMYEDKLGKEQDELRRELLGVKLEKLRVRLDSS
jgi:hypothetical protein